MGFSRAWGGPELSSPQLEVIEGTVLWDASAGWCAEIGSHTGLFAPYLAGRWPWRCSQLDVITTGMLFPVGRASACPRLPAVRRWTSAAASPLRLGDLRAPSSTGRAAGPEPRRPRPARLAAVHGACRRHQRIDNWDTTGMLGTGSCDYTIADVFRCRRSTRSASTPCSTTTARTPSRTRSCATCPVCHWVWPARRSTTCGIWHHQRYPNGDAWADNRRVQTVIAECEADYIATGTACAHPHAAGRSVGRNGTLDDLTVDERARCRCPGLHAFPHRAVDRHPPLHLLQTASIHRASPSGPLAAGHHDMCQHLFAQERILQSGGAHLLGGTPDFRLCLGIVK